MIYKSRYLDIVLIIISFYSIYFIVHKFLGGKVPFWDFHIIYCQSKTFFLGNIPYGFDVHGDCLDPKITLTANLSVSTLELLKYIGLINIKTANFLWVFLEIISLFLVFIIFGKIFKFDQNWRNIFLFFFSFGSVVFFSFFSGNLSVILYGFLAIGIYFLEKRLFNYYYITILFVSLFKFYYLTFLLLPFYILGWKSIKKILITFFLFFVIQYFFYIKNPELTITFFDVIQGKYQEDLPTRFLTGTGLYSIIEKMPWIFLGINNFENSFFSLQTNLFIWFIISSTIFLSILYCLNNKKIKNSKNHFLFCISFGILVISLIIPRLVVYDLILTVPILFYLLNRIDFKKFKIDEFKSKFFFIFLFLVFFDHHFPFFAIISLLTLFIYSEFYKKDIFIY
ncbi:MAG: hypothetical protein MK002_03905 [Alphaproteobacteria bacterium]|nr:hypothetical protein [Alphaproteobacteria bacterium]